MYSKSENKPENQFVSDRREGIIIVDSWFLAMSFCHQVTLEAVDSFAFVRISLVYPTKAYCFSSRRQIDESLSLFIHQTRELLSH